MADDSTDFFAAPPSGDAPLPPPAEDAGFTLLGEAEAPAPSTDAAAFVGDVQDAPPTDGGDDMLGFAAAPPPGVETVDDDAGEMGFAAAPPALSDDAAPIILGAPPPDDAGAGDDDVFGGAVVTDTSPIDSGTGGVDSKPSAMAKFNVEFQETLQKRKEEEDAAKVEMEAAAKLYLEDFKAKRQAKSDAKMAKNREDEQAKLESIEADLENDNSWQRVSKMVELTQDSAQLNEDTKQMRDLFIKLKNEDGLAAKVGA